MVTQRQEQEMIRMGETRQQRQHQTEPQVMRIARTAKLER
jgi:hypothetical protein